MKKLSVLFLMVVSFLVVSCDNNETGEIEEQVIDSSTISSESESDAIFDEVDGFTVESIVLEGFLSRTNLKLKDTRVVIPECATIFHDREAKLITIDFGSGCEGRFGRVHAGKVMVSYTERGYLPGAELTTTFDGYTVDDNLIAGVRVVKNISESIFSNPRFEVTLTGGKITYTDGTTITREVNRVREWIRTESLLTDQFIIAEESTAKGTNRKGESYNTLVTSNLVYTVECGLEEVFIPVSGTKLLTVEGRDFNIDFGDGTCDNIITVTYNNFSTDIDLTPES